MASTSAAPAPRSAASLNFRANGRMRMGHVAVVSNVVDARNIEIDHANWAGPGASRGGVSRNITVVDVSSNNDWTAVRVALGHTGEFGSIYPTFGFIYDRPDSGTLVANSARAPAPLLNAAPRDLRRVIDRTETATATQDVEEVAEAADDVSPRFTRGSRHARMSHMPAGRGYGRSFADPTYASRSFAGTSYGSHAFATHAFSSHAFASHPAGRVAVTRVQTRFAPTAPAVHGRAAARHHT